MANAIVMTDEQVNTRLLQILARYAAPSSDLHGILMRHSLTTQELLNLLDSSLDSLMELNKRLRADCKRVFKRSEILAQGTLL